jgi:hypothetical protein
MFKQVAVERNPHRNGHPYSEVVRSSVATTTIEEYYSILESLEYYSSWLLNALES